MSPIDKLNSYVATSIKTQLSWTLKNSLNWRLSIGKGAQQNYRHHGKYKRMPSIDLYRTVIRGDKAAHDGFWLGEGWAADC